MLKLSKNKRQFSSIFKPNFYNFTQILFPVVCDHNAYWSVVDNESDVR